MNMPKFVYAYHGGKKPETDEEMGQVMTAWKNWLGGLGPAVIDGGNPVGMSKTVTAGGVEDNGGANPLSGYGLVEAKDLDQAVEMAKGCPILQNNGTVEVAEAIDM
jgi:hypothetical protein